MGSVGFSEMVLIGFVALLVYGDRLPFVARDVGRFVEKMRRQFMDIKWEINRAIDAEEAAKQPPEPPPALPEPAPAENQDPPPPAPSTAEGPAEDKPDEPAPPSSAEGLAPSSVEGPPPEAASSDVPHAGELPPEAPPAEALPAEEPPTYPPAPSNAEGPAAP